MDYSVNFNETNGESDRVAVIATKPLTHQEDWIEMGRGQLLMFDNGLPYSRPYDMAVVEKSGRGLSTSWIRRSPPSNSCLLDAEDNICPLKVRELQMFSSNTHCLRSLPLCFSLQQQYQCNIPKLLCRLTCKALGKGEGNDCAVDLAERAVDLGCGSGESGAQFRPHVKYLTGVDLNPEMAKVAQRRVLHGRKCYDQIVIGDAECILHEEKEDGWECSFVFACDLFPYVGDLSPMFDAVRTFLRKRGGTFSFSAEIMNESFDGSKEEDGSAGFVLQSCARFAHKRSYVKSLAAEFGFVTLSSTESTVLRQHDGKDVQGALVVLSLPSL